MLTIDRKPLLKALDIVRHVTSGNSGTLPILSNVLLRCGTRRELYLETCDLHTFVRTRVSDCQGPRCLVAVVMPYQLR